MPFLREYGVATTVYFPLISYGVTSFTSGSAYTPAAGDVRITIDGGTPNAATNLPTGIVVSNAKIWKMDLTAGEVTGKTIAITIIDATTKVVEDQMLVVETYGDGQGQVDIRDWVDAIFKRDLSLIVGEATRSLLNAIRFLRNKWSISGTTLTVTKEDDATTAWTAELTQTPGADPITGTDPG